MAAVGARRVFAVVNSETAKLIEDKTKFDLAALPKIVDALNGDKVALEKVNEILNKQVMKKGEAGLTEVLKLKQASDDYKDQVAKVLDKDKSPDGAKGVHDDAHALWINPKDGRHMVVAATAATT